MNRAQPAPGQSVVGDVGGPGLQGISVSDALGVQRVLLGQIGTPDLPDYGLKVVSSDGSTVIIDGTSDVFKIVATGTLTRAFPAAGNTNTANVVLNALGSSYTVSPAMLINITDASAFDDRYVATVVATNGAGVIKWQTYATVNVHGAGTDGTPVVTIFADSETTNPGGSAKLRYWLMTESAF